MYCAAGKHLEVWPDTKVITAGNLSVHVYADNDYVSKSLQNTPPFWDINGVKQLLWALNQSKSEKQQAAARQLRATQSAAQASMTEQQQQQASGPDRPPLMVDVGAHVGWYGFSAAAAGARTAFFEAMPSNNRLLRRSICSSAWLADRITLYATGLSNKSAECSIISEDLNQGNGITICDQDAQQGVQAVTAMFKDRYKFLARDKITVRRLDAMLSEEVQVMKIDVEGHEKQMVQGAEGLLSTSNGGIVWYIMANFNREMMSKDDQLWYLQFLDRMGYKISEKSFQGPFYDAAAVKDGTVKVEHHHPDLYLVRKELG
ncbi:hypothetical protein OEZ86_004238 [Tetradesmus obliquus]|nr:hypothetical protein OEZ86_004238 [Tetradesmus obliquus]